MRKKGSGTCETDWTIRAITTEWLDFTDRSSSRLPKIFVVAIAGVSPIKLAVAQILRIGGSILIEKDPPGYTDEDSRRRISKCIADSDLDSGFESRPS